MHQQHRHAHQPAQQRERRQQAEQAAFVVHPQGVVEVERHAQQHVAHGHAEHQRRHQAAGEQRPVPYRPPARIGHLAAELETDRPQDQRHQDQEHRDVEAREADRIQRRERREDRAAAQDQPDLVAFPHRPDDVQHDAPLLVGAGHRGQQRGHPQVEAVHHREADQQDAQQQPPDQPQRGVVERNRVHPQSPVSLPGPVEARGCRAPGQPGARGPSGSACASARPRRWPAPCRSARIR